MPEQKHQQDLRYDLMDSPVGPLLLAGDAMALHYLSFANGSRSFGPSAAWLRDERPFAEARRQLKAYFAGGLRHFELPLHLSGTSFQKEIWQRLAKIPFGETRTYGWLARQVGRPKASRAVGAANGANPLPIVLPCHRVIGANGSLTGFGGGIETKRFLLEHEGAAFRH